jgi:glucose-6-phosphate dehydrogenase assembly protein OpcA
VAGATSGGSGAAPPSGGPGVAEPFTRGEPISVEVDKIERALADLWKEASRAGAAESGQAISRAALWNIVVPTRAQDLARTKKTVDELAPLVPARVLVLVEEGDRAGGLDVDGAPEGVRATIESNVVSRASGARVVYSEEITLRGAGDAHFGGLVRALQVPGLPTATIWADPTMPEALLRRQLRPATDRLIFDTGRCARPRQLLELERCADLARGAIPVADLGWLRLASFRALFAGLFDPPVGGGALRRARRVSIEHRPGAEVSGLLLAAWLASALDWLFVAAEPGGGARFRFDRSGPGGADAGPVEIVLAPSPGECGTSGIVALELVADEPRASDGQVAASTYAVRRTEQNHATLTLPIAPPRAVKLDSRTDAELCLAALGPSGRDPLFRRALSLAARLAAVANA